MTSRAELILDACASPTVGSRRWGAYFVCGFSGYIAGLALVTVLANYANLDVASRLVLTIVPPASLLLGIKISQLIFGHERIVFYEQAISTVGATALGALVIDGPVGTLVDLSTLGIGTFLVLGRIGCFRVACCHGRRAERGVVYREDHAAAGFPSRWVGVRLWPLQLVDSGLAVVMVGLSTWYWLDGAPPGGAACTFVAGYGVGRYLLELWRGDTARPRLGGVSESQWIGLVTTGGAAVWHPEWWTIVAAMVTVAATLMLVVGRRMGAFDWLWLAGPWHVTEVAGHLGYLASRPGSTVTTSEGLRLSAARLPDGRLDVIVSRPLRLPSVGALTSMAAQLGRPWRQWTVMTGRTPGLVHVILDDRS